VSCSLLAAPASARNPGGPSVAHSPRLGDDALDRRQQVLALILELRDGPGKAALAVTRQTDPGPAPVLVAGFANGEARVLGAADGAGDRVRLDAQPRLLTSDGMHHLLGTCRMGTDPETSVVGPDCRSHDVPNPWICDGSVFPTAGAVNPNLTIQAIATRTARLALADADEQRRAA
jgi:choline dehydrogenase-like flavoprotein